MTGRKSILVVHNVENIRSARRSTMDYIYAFERYAPDNDYVYHRIQLPVTAVLRETDWDAVIFDSTSLGVVTIRPRERFHRLREEWAFLRSHPAVKIAFPQDDASHSALYDYWLHWMRTDVVFTVRPEKVERLYPLTSKSATFVPTVAGFLDDKSLHELAARARPWHERGLVMGQRVTRYPAWGGRFARRKSDIVLRIGEECARRGLPVDISTDTKDVLHGDEWFDFLGNCRFVAGAEGGHGLCDPYGAIQDAVNDYVARHPDAEFEEIEQACFEGLDGQELFPGFAPRVLEAALMGCGQLMLEGHYRGFIRPGEHYIEVRDDYANLDDVFAQMSNPDHVAGMIANCTRDLVLNPAFRFSTLVADLFGWIETRQRTDKRRQSTDSHASRIRRRHFDELRDALAVVGVERERLYEPYLTPWVIRELSGQIRNEDEARELGIDLSDPEQPANTSARLAVAAAAFDHACTLIGSLPSDPDSVPQLLSALRSGIGRDLVYAAGQIRDVCGTSGAPGDIKTLVCLLLDNNSPPAEQVLDRPEHPVQSLLGIDAELLMELLRLSSDAPPDAATIARKLSWPSNWQEALAVLGDTDLGDAHPNGRYVADVLRLLAADGLPANVIRLLARYASGRTQ